MFSSRLPSRIGANAFARSVAAARASGTALVDLTNTNPTSVGLVMPAEISTALADPAGVSYAPEPLGMLSARAAVAAEMGSGIDPRHVVLTTSTSEGYAFLFKLLCDPGDEVLVPQPSYPLFDLLTTLEGVRPVPYRLDAQGAGCVDRASLEAAVSSRTRAILVVSPNNPTGSMLRRADAEWLVALAAARGLAIVADEVFASYPLTPPADAVSLLAESRVLVFTLGGLSKSAGLPQMKLAWIAASGPSPQLDEAMSRLEIIADTYLSVGTPVQLAASRLLAAGYRLRTAITGRLAENLAALRRLFPPASAIRLIEPHGGWSAVLRVPAILSEEALVLRLVDDRSVLVHPGYFFDFQEEAHLVVSLLPEPQVFREGLTRIVDWFRAEGAA
jgi:alanine-synthesizing transaminase